MCIIVAKKKGITLPSEETLRTCWNRNSDGAGLMYVTKEGKLKIEKGFMTFESLKVRLAELSEEYNLEEKSLVIHFRIGTSGGNIPENTHPFPISDKVEDLKSLAIEPESELALAHNGIIHTYSYDVKEAGLSDTQLFVRDCVSTLHQYDNEFYRKDKPMKLINDVLGGDRLCILNKNEELFYLGDWEEEEGVMYSNTTYKPFVYTYTYGSGSSSTNLSKSYGYDYADEDWWRDTEDKWLYEEDKNYDEKVDEFYDLLGDDYLAPTRDYSICIRDEQGKFKKWVQVNFQYQYVIDREKKVYYVNWQDLQLEEEGYGNLYLEGAKDEEAQYVTIENLFKEKDAEKLKEKKTNEK